MATAARPVLRPAGDETAFTAKNRAVLKNVKDVVAHKSNALEPGIQQDA